MNDKIKLFQWGAGSADTLTGLMLIFAPALTLRMMGMKQAPEPAEMVSYVGVFVMAVGLSYFMVRENDRKGWEMQWKITALVRFLVAGFLVCKIIFEGWDSCWGIVLLTDLGIAVIQWTGLRKGWLETEKTEK